MEALLYDIIQKAKPLIIYVLLQGPSGKFYVKDKDIQ